MLKENFNKEIFNFVGALSIILVFFALLHTYHWLVGDYAFAGTVAFVGWYIGFGFESAMNGTMKTGIFMPFYCLWEDIRCNIPFYGWRYRLKLSNGDEEWAAEFPGLIHLTWTHVIVPTALYFGTLELFGTIYGV